jgi:hypothetical protein
MVMIWLSRSIDGYDKTKPYQLMVMIRLSRSIDGYDKTKPINWWLRSCSHINFCSDVPTSSAEYTCLLNSVKDFTDFSLGPDTKYPEAFSKFLQSIQQARYYRTLHQPNSTYFRNPYNWLLSSNHAKLTYLNHRQPLDFKLQINSNTTLMQLLLLLLLLLLLHWWRYASGVIGRSAFSSVEASL